MPKQEGPPLNNRAEILFSDIRSKLSRAIRHPYLPDWAQDHLQESLRKMKMLRDDKFETVVASQMITDSESARDQIADTVSRVNGICTEAGLIYMRRSYFAADLLASSSGQDLIAEELGHSFKKTKPAIPLFSIPEGSWLLSPFKTHAEVIEDLCKSDAEYFTGKPQFRPEDITVTTWGFDSIFRDTRLNRSYPISLAQRTFEESRSAIIQTFLEGFYLGTVSAGYEKPVPRFDSGMRVLLARINGNPILYSREYGAIQFLNAVAARNFNARELIDWIIPALYEKNLHEFLEGLSPDESAAFELCFRAVTGDFIRRPSTEPVRNLVYKR
jgi:hypothetical protein